MKTSTERISIDGMTCGSCVRHVRQALENLEGVDVKNIEIGSAEVDIDPEVIDREEIIRAIREEGYGAN
jgi:copper chaperone